MFCLGKHRKKKIVDLLLPVRKRGCFYIHSSNQIVCCSVVRNVFHAASTSLFRDRVTISGKKSWDLADKKQEVGDRGNKRILGSLERYSTTGP